MEKIVFLDSEGLPAKLRPPCFSHEWREYPTSSLEVVVERLRDATIAIVDRVFLGEAELAQLPHLKLIAVAATGFDNVDIAACRRRGIAVTNVRNWSKSVPEHVFALILALRRDLLSYHDAVQCGAWQRADNYTLLHEPMPLSLSGSTLGLIGCGGLGRAVVDLAKAFGMRVLIAERKGAGTIRDGRTSFADVMAESSVLVVLCPLTEETRGLIGSAELGRMPRHGLLINCARGGIVDEQALAAALRRGDIAGAGVDVLSEEPPRSGNPLLTLKQPNLIVTPHFAWASVESLQALADQLIDNIEGFVAGTPRNLVE